MFAAISPSPSLTWLVWEFCISLLAAIGGIVVLIGLWLEGYREPESHPTIQDYRSFKAREARGRKWVFWGVAFEVLLAFGMTFKDGLDIRELEAAAQKNDPLNAQINSASAVLRLKVKGVSGVPFNTPGGGVFIPPKPEDANFWGGGSITLLEGTNLQKIIYRLSSGAADIGWVGSGLVKGPDDWRGVIIHFQEDNLGDWESFWITNKFTTGPSLRRLNDIGSFYIRLPEMQTNVSIVSGVLELKANTARWQFPVPAQTQRYGIISSCWITNMSDQLEAKVLRVPIMDWISPPRFTNRVYTGEP
jgi:hypothetical protein